MDSTRGQATLGDRAWKELLTADNAIVREALAQYRGLECDTANDGFLATFDGPARAIFCALDIVERVRSIGIEVRAGIHTGECELVDGKVAGLAVSTGARIAAKATASEVLVLQTVADLVAGSHLAFEEAGEHELKGPASSTTSPQRSIGAEQQSRDPMSSVTAAQSRRKRSCR